MKLRTTVAVVMTMMSCLALAIAIGLIILTSALNELSSRLGTAVERVRVLMELEAHALQGSRQEETLDIQAMSDIVNRLEHTSDSDFSRDRQTLARMIDLAGRAPTPVERRAHVAAAMALLREVVDREDEAARETTTLAASWNRRANVIGVAAVLVVLVGLIVPLGWVRRRALEPLVGVADAIERFAAGNREVRAPLVGASEFRQVAVRFNEMAVALQRQHEQQLAFVGGVAHDLRNPLNALRIAGALLQEESHDAPRIGRQISRQVMQLERLVNDLLDRTRIEAGRLDLLLELHDLRDVVSRALDEQRALLPTRLFTMQSPEHPVFVKCDMLRIEQVMHNLLSNAAKYSPDCADIEVRIEHDLSYAAVSVIDHGIGLTNSGRERLFEPFMRGENVGAVGGIGLGLSVTRRIVDAHGGHIDARSTQGGGSTFVVRLPLAAADSLPSSRTDAAHQPEAGVAAALRTLESGATRAPRQYW